MKLMADHIIWIGFGFALFSFGAIYWYKRKQILSKVIIFSTNWKESWASTLTVFSGILSTVLSASFFPENSNPIMTKIQFQTLQIFFPILVVIAGFAVDAFNNICAIEIKEKIYSPVWPLLLGSSLVLWAFVGELITIILLFQKLKFAEVFSKHTTILSQIFFLIMIFIGVAYVFISVGRTIEKAKTKDEVEQDHRIVLTHAFLP